MIGSKTEKKAVFTKRTINSKAQHPQKTKVLSPAFQLSNCKRPLRHLHRRKYKKKKKNKFRPRFGIKMKAPGAAMPIKTPPITQQRNELKRLPSNVGYCRCPLSPSVSLPFTPLLSSSPPPCVVVVTGPGSFGHHRFIHNSRPAELYTTYGAARSRDPQNTNKRLGEKGAKLPRNEITTCMSGSWTETGSGAMNGPPERRSVYVHSLVPRRQRRRAVRRHYP